MKFKGGPVDGKECEVDPYSAGVNVPIAPEIKVHMAEDIKYYLNRYDRWIGFVDGRQVSPPVFGTAKYDKRQKSDGKKYLVYVGDVWPDDSLETFLRENRE